jgi:hypothetical protein
MKIKHLVGVIFATTVMTSQAASLSMVDELVKKVEARNGAVNEGAGFKMSQADEISVSKPGADSIVRKLEKKVNQDQDKTLKLNLSTDMINAQGNVMSDSFVPAGGLSEVQSLALSDGQLFKVPSRVQPNSGPRNEYGSSASTENLYGLYAEQRLGQCGAGSDRATSDLLGSPNRYSYFVPTLGQLAGEIESIPVFKGQVRSKTGPVLMQAAKIRESSIQARDLNNRIYESESPDYVGTGWEDSAKFVRDDGERKINEGIQYITKRAVTDVQIRLNTTLVQVSIPVKSGERYFDRGIVWRTVDKNAADVLDQCRSYWANPDQFQG